MTDNEKKRPDLSGYVSTRVFDGIRPLSSEMVERLKKNYYRTAMLPGGYYSELLCRLWDAGDGGVEIQETTPKLGGFRLKPAQLLVQLGKAEWIIEGKVLRAKYSETE